MKRLFLFIISILSTTLASAQNPLKYLSVRANVQFLKKKKKSNNFKLYN